MKVLAFVNAHNLAHVTRPLEVAKLLAPRGHEIVFAGEGKYLAVAAAAGFETRELPYLPLSQMLEAIRSQRLDRLYPLDQLDTFVQAERALLEECRPDAALVDCRMTATTSAELAGVPTIAIVNVHMTLRKALPFYSLQNATPRLPRWLSAPVDRVTSTLEHLLWDQLVIRRMHRLRSSYRLPRRYSYQLEEGDLTLFPDIPEFSPVRRLPPNAHYVGPLVWRNDLAAPVAFESTSAAAKQIYFSLGSVSLEHLAGQLRELGKREDTRFVVSTGGVETPTDQPVPANVALERYVNADALLPHCDAVVCHGGNGTIYQALNYGLPIVGVATHAEQAYGLNRLVRLGLGVRIGTSQLERRGVTAIIEGIDQVLSEPTYRRNARIFQTLLRRWRGAERAAQLIEQFLLQHTAGRSWSCSTRPAPVLAATPRSGSHAGAEALHLEHGRST